MDEDRLIPEGDYLARALQWKFGVTEKGAPQIAVLFEITQDGAQKGRKITKYLYFTEKTTDRSADSLRYMGWEGTDFTELQEGGSGRLDKEEVTIVIERKPDQHGAMRNEVAWVNRASGIRLKNEMSKDQVADFAKMMSEKLRQSDIRRRTKESGSNKVDDGPRREPTPPPPSGSPPVSDDDIPF